MPLKRLLPALERLETGIDKVRYRFSAHLDERPMTIHPYLGFGNHEEVHLEGRVLRNRPLDAASADDAAWRNALSMARRFESDEVPGVAVRLQLQGHTQEVTTDDEGYFHAVFPLTEPLPADRTWHDVHLELADHDARATGKVLVPPATASFAVVSDIDDTVLRTGATNFVAMARRTLFQNAHTRQAFEGVGDFYHALLAGPDGSIGPNPLFYVSSSPWNIYDFLQAFIKRTGLPEGPLFLRDLGLSRTQVGGGRHETHKLGRITTLLETYPELPFILIGDSGQHDPEIYRKVVDQYPGRVRAIYIRDVTPDVRDAEVEKLAEAVHEQGVDLLLAPSTTVFAAHAAEMGLVENG